MNRGRSQSGEKSTIRSWLDADKMNIHSGTKVEGKLGRWSCRDSHVRHDVDKEIMLKRAKGRTGINT